MKYLFNLTALALLIVVSSCGNSNSNNTMIDNHTAQNSLDWQGSYYGVLPCASCEGIETELTINEDLTYTLVSTYLGKPMEITDSLAGSFVWEGNNIKLLGITEGSASPFYKVEENRIRHLDLNGEQITGELENAYILRKLGNPLVEDIRWQLVELNGKVIEGSPESHFILFHSKERRVEARANCNYLSLPYKIIDSYRVEFGGGISTMMACPDNTEAEFLAVLGEVDNLSVNDSTLTLNKARMAPLAQFKRVSSQE